MSQSKKHILFSVNSSWNVINFRSGLIQGFVAAGYRVTVVAPKDDYSARIEPLGADYVELPMRQQGTSMLQDGMLMLHYLQVLRKLKPDFYLGYTIKPNIYGSLAAHCYGVPVLNNVAGLGNVFVRGGWIQNLAKFLYKLALRRSRTVFFQNPDDRQLFLEQGMVSHAQAGLLPGSGVDLNRFQRTAYSARDGAEMEFLFVGRLLKDKGLLDLVEATRMVKREYPKIRVSLLGFVGVANPSAVSLAEVQQWQSEGLLHYEGSSDDVRPFLRHADCLVLPSAYREGTPRSLIEAGAIGLPLITTNMPGCREIVDHGYNGLLCEAKNPQSLADVMLDMIRMPLTERKQMAANSRDKVEQEYDEKIVLKKYLEVLLGL
ncbi:glycosyltransferase family 4 protein [Rubritalea marina]|uniref:glycosyltransferase family 4 protein n=1 Tax=Rubritalea marina TaxID=361055 RepID=UPI000381F302|nr:glycosyltransferase family 4 protein [Rubritalea marina]